MERKGEANIMHAILGGLVPTSFSDQWVHGPRVYFATQLERKMDTDRLRWLPGYRRHAIDRLLAHEA